MFWWFCGDFSNMVGIFTKVTKNAHHEEKPHQSINGGEQFNSIFTYNSPENFAANRYGAFNGF
jgi:hypothetical protein